MQFENTRIEGSRSAWWRPRQRLAAHFVGLMALLGTAAVPVTAAAQNFPQKPVQLIVPYPPGGSIDTLSRLMENKLSEIWGQPVIVVNKPGASTTISTDFVARSAPDGHTLGLVATAHTINPSLLKSLPYDTVKDFSAITILASSPVVFLTTSSLEVNSLAELIDMVKKQPGKYSYATPGVGTTMHLAGEWLNTLTGTDIMHVPYKGAGLAYPDVISGRVPLMIDSLPSSISHIQAGKLKPLAVLSDESYAGPPAIPSSTDTLPGYVVESTVGMVVPSATPREFVRKIHEDVIKVLQMPDVRERMLDVGLTPVGNGPEEYDAIIRDEIERWATVVEKSGASLD